MQNTRKFFICNQGIIRCLEGIRNIRACKKSTSLSSPHQEARYLKGVRNVRHARGLGSCKKVGVMQEGNVGIKPVRLEEIQAETADSSSQ